MISSVILKLKTYREELTMIDSLVRKLKGTDTDFDLLESTREYRKAIAKELDRVNRRIGELS